jgi:hypothetical protein
MKLIGGSLVSDDDSRSDNSLPKTKIKSLKPTKKVVSDTYDKTLDLVKE